MQGGVHASRCFQATLGGRATSFLAGHMLEATMQAIWANLPLVTPYQGWPTRASPGSAPGERRVLI